MTSLTIHMFLPYFPVLEAQDTRHSAHASRSLATWPSQMQTQVMSPNEFDKIISVDDTMLINDPNHNFSDFLKTTNENTRQFGVPTVFESSVLHVSHDGFALRIEGKESMQSGNRCWTERNRRKRRFCDQCCIVYVKECLLGRYECESEESQKILFWRITENSIRFWWLRSPRTPGMKSSTSYSWWKFRSEKIIFDWVRHRDPKFGTKKLRIRIIRVATRAWISNTTIHWTDQV